MKKQKEQTNSNSLVESRLQPDSVTKPDPRERLLEAIEQKKLPESVTEIGTTLETPEQLRFKMQELFDNINQTISPSLYNPDLILKTPIENLGIEFNLAEMEKINSLIVIYGGLLLAQIKYIEKFPPGQTNDERYAGFLESEYERISAVGTLNDDYIKTQEVKQREEVKDQVYEDIYRGKQERETDVNFDRVMELYRVTFEKKVLPHLMQASHNDYSEWLTHYMLYKDGTPSHKYDYPMPKYGWFVAKSDFRMVPLYGARLVHIIVPTSVKYLGGDLGHSRIYFLKDYTHLGDFVPQYTNT